MPWRRTAQLFLGIVTLLVPSCALYPDDNEPPKQENEKGLQFAAADYSKNAKEYMDAGDYHRAKDQWTKQLELEPGNWKARLGVAFCNLYLSHESVLARRDLGEAHTLVQAADQGFRELWDGTIEPDAVTADPAHPQWAAALGAAMATRHLGYIDQLEVNRYEEIIARGGAEAANAKVKQKDFASRRDRNYEAAIALFERLAAQQHASPEATKNLGELYIVTKRDAEAERLLRQYLEMARRTRNDDLAKAQASAAQNFEPDQQEVVRQIVNEKLTSNTEKQVSVLVDLAHLAWDRGEYLNAKKCLDEALATGSERRDLYLKLGEVEGKLKMYETGLQHINEYLRRSSQRREEYGDDIHTAYRLQKEYQAELAARAPK